MQSARSFTLALLLFVVTGGCTVGPNYRAPASRLPGQFSAATQPATRPAAVDLKRWWEGFNDPTLNQFVERALYSNLDVRLANARIREARAELAFSRAALFPTLDSSASYVRNRSSKNAFAATGKHTSSQSSTGTGGSGTVGTGTGGTGTGDTTTGGTGAGGASGPGTTTAAGANTAVFALGETNLYQAGFDAGWEIDVFGGTRRAVEAAQASFQGQVEARRNALVTLLSEVAQNYVMLRGLQHELRVVRGNVEAQRATLDLQRLKLGAGLASNLIITQATAQAESTESQIPTLEIKIEQTIQRLGVLLDVDPETLRPQLSAAPELPSGPGAIPPGLPSDLLRRRPDVRQAERQLAAATANIGVATADLFPKFNLTGSLGLESLQLKSLANSASVFWSAGPTVSWRIFDAGQVWANIHVQNARQEQALIQYRRAVIQSLSDVENALTAYDRERARSASLRRAAEANRQAVDLAKQLNDAGVVDFLNVLTAQQSLYQSEDQLAQSEQAVLTNLIALYKALGGGWETTEAAADAQPREPDAAK